MKVLIDPGHGGPFPGACVDGVREADVNLSVARKMLPFLRSPYVEAWLTRDGDYALYEHDKFRDIAMRAQMAGRCGADILLSLHCNNFHLPQVYGLEVWTTVGQNNSDVVADEIIEALTTAFPSQKLRSDTDDGDLDREKDFNLIREAPCRAVLVEMGFLSNDYERMWLIDGANQTRMAEALAGGLFAWQRKHLMMR